MDDYGCDDYFETHDCDDYREFEDNEAWLDMRGEFDDDFAEDADCGYIDDMPIGG